MVSVLVEDGKTGMEYKVKVNETVKTIPVGFSGLSHNEYFEVKILKPRVNFWGIRLYKIVKTSYKCVSEVSSVTVLIEEEFKEYLKSFEEYRNEIFELNKSKEERTKNMRDKYDSLPHKMVIR